MDLSAELATCREFLKADQRNFHCWIYRRYVVDISHGQISDQNEFDFTTEKIQENFSNYSAFHHRSVYIKQLDVDIQALLEGEFAIIENAIFTEPDDQSAWWYHQFLLRWAKEKIKIDTCSESDADSSGKRDWFEGVLQQQIELIRSLLEIEPRSKWGITCLVNLIDAVSELRTDRDEPLLQERRELLNLLIDIDPVHIKRYMYKLQK